MALPTCSVRPTIGLWASASVLDEPLVAFFAHTFVDNKTQLTSADMYIGRMPLLCVKSNELGQAFASWADAKGVESQVTATNMDEHLKRSPLCTEGHVETLLKGANVTRSRFKACKRCAEAGQCQHIAHVGHGNAIERLAGDGGAATGLRGGEQHGCGIQRSSQGRRARRRRVNCHSTIHR